jgi:hypothetical protein
MNDDEMIKVVKEVGSDVKLLTNFLAKLSAFIAISTRAEHFDCGFASNQDKDGTSYKGLFKFKKVSM